MAGFKNGFLELGAAAQGSWTPTLEGTTSAGSANYTVQSGTYIKISNLVYLQFRLQFNSASGTGNLKITGIPFPPTSTPEYIGVGSVAIANMPFSVSTQYANSRILAGNNFLELEESEDDGGFALIDMDGTGEIRGSIFYLTD